MNILVTGGAGFIGSALTRRLIQDGHTVVVIDSFNDYYDVQLKRARQQEFLAGSKVYEVDITDHDQLSGVFTEHQFDLVCHLAAQAGVRYSLEAPSVYVNTNVLGTQLLYELMRQHNVPKMILASSSSVYGTSTMAPFKETDSAVSPVSVYAATKRAAELVGHAYHEQYGTQTTALRFFTVYGPWGRPDMALFKFANLMQSGKPIEIYNEGNLQRDFTYIDDIVNGFVSAVATPLTFEIINLGYGSPVKLMDMVAILETALGMDAVKELVPMQTGDVYETFADTSKAESLLGFRATVPITTGIESFANWYKAYYGMVADTAI